MLLHVRRLSAGAQAVLSFAAILILLGLMSSPAFAATASPTPTPSPTPQEPVSIAQITEIVTGGEKTVQAAIEEAKVIRAGVNQEEPAQFNMSLFAGDIVETGSNTQLTVVFADTEDPLVNNTEVILYPKTRVSINSIWTWFGSVFNRVRGYFNSGGGAVAGATGSTEFIVSVQDTQTELTVLEGTVSALVFDIVIFDNFLKNQPGSNVIAVKNRCRKTHAFKVKRPETIPWLELSPEQVTIKPGQSATVVPTVKLEPGKDAPAPATYLGDVTSLCLDCNTEPGCSFKSWLDRFKSVEVTVRSQVVPVAKREELSQPRQENADTKIRELKGEELTKEVNETNDLIIAASAKDLAPNVLPNFSSVEERNQAFRDARLQTVLSEDEAADKNAVTGYKVLGDVYLDWGKGTRAVQAYEKVEPGESSLTEPATFRANYGEALRLVGKLEDAQAQVGKAVELEKNDPSVRTLTAQGNVYLDKARQAIKLNQDAQTIEGFLDQAQTSYIKASGLQQTLRPQQKAALQTNLGDFYSIKRDLAYEKKIAAPECLNELSQCVSQLNENAMSAYGAAINLEPKYLYAVAGSAYAKLARANIAKLKGDRAAKENYDQARAQFEQVRSLDPTYQPTYTGLGIVYENLNSKTRAQEQFQLATQLTPKTQLIFSKVPDVGKKPKLVAMKIIADAGLIPVTSGDGEFVTNQDPPPGTALKPGSKVNLRLEPGNVRVFSKSKISKGSNPN